MELRRLLGAFKRKLALLILLSILGAGAAGGFSVMTSIPLYESRTTLYIMNKRNLLSGQGISFEDIAISKQLIQDYGYIIVSRKVLSPVVQELGIQGLTEDHIASAIRVSLREESNVMYISVKWSDPATAKTIANAVSRSFTVQMLELTGFDSVVIIDEAMEPTRPLPSGNSKMALIGLAAGLFLAVAYVYIRELFDSTIREAEEIEKGLGLKVLGVIPEFDIQ